MVHTFHPWRKTMNDRVRFTIAVDPEVHDAFADLAHSSGVSLSRCIGDWLRDTSEAAQMTTIKVNEARKAPEEVVRAYKLLMAQDTLEARARYQQTAWGRGHGAAGLPEGQRMSRGGIPGGVAGRKAVPAQPVPPSSNTGGKSPGKTRGPR
jgi:hypothetical protein